MNKHILIAIVFLVALVPGCASHTYSALSSQTLEQPGARDVVWVLEDDASNIIRCHHEGERPVCQRAEMR